MNGLRIAGWTLIGIALALLGADIISSLEQGLPVVRTTREVMNLIPGVAIDSLGTDGPAGVVNLLIDLPLWAFLGGLGILVAALLRGAKS